MAIQARDTLLQAHMPNRVQSSLALVQRRHHLQLDIQSMKEERRKREDMPRKHTISELAPILLLVGSNKAEVNFSQPKLHTADTHNSLNLNHHTVRRNMEFSLVRQHLEPRRLLMEVNPNLVAV
jgi:hypothetical protein